MKNDTKLMIELKKTKSVEELFEILISASMEKKIKWWYKYIHVHEFTFYTQCLASIEDALCTYSIRLFKTENPYDIEGNKDYKLWISVAPSYDIYNYKDASDMFDFRLKPIPAKLAEKLIFNIKMCGSKLT